MKAGYRIEQAQGSRITDWVYCRLDLHDEKRGMTHIEAALLTKNRLHRSVFKRFT